ncbi:DUF262 domain-containing protein [Sphingobacterium psychroaquaticum]|uniref:DUF262 domain-containing protein n=1 Tax=Sphingobacterium psychroaquaticum TaxID=561061 RepID=UPI00141A91C8|nr:DUF262 domain-containing protein [Sphingobacterium psychroaquaticum]
MINNNLLDTKTVNFNEILSSGKIYRVPQFQRDYSWSQDNWEDLWNDIIIAEENKTPHYMGSIVLQSNTSKEYSIIDGQQRFTTLSILTLAIIKSIKNLVDRGIEVAENNERIEILMRQYIGEKNPSSLTYSSKLFLNENNDSFFQSRLIRFLEPINTKKLIDSEKLLWGSYEFFLEKLSSKFHQNGSDYALFLNSVVGELMLFIQITVEDELNAYTVFETLNSRGVELTSTDLLKNFLFSQVAKSDSDLKQVKEQWKRIIDIIGLKDFPNFLRYYLISTRKLITKDYLFKEIKTFIKSSEDVFELLDKLEFYAHNYKALGNPDDELWSEDKELKGFIVLLKVFRVLQWKPLAMVGLEKLSRTDFFKLIKSLVIISFRYNVISKMQTNEMEKIYSRAAIKLINGNSKSITAILNDIKSLYVHDDEFKNYFSVKQFNTNNSIDKKILRYILYKIESQLNGGADYDFESDKGTIEHILPESYSEPYKVLFSEEEFHKNIFLLGNMTLLEAQKNSKEASNKAFPEKLAIYKTSKYKIAADINAETWTSKLIKYRQANMAKIASSIWSLNF